MALPHRNAPKEPTGISPLINSLVSELMKAEHRRLSASVQKLIASNKEFFPHSSGFMYGGQAYVESILSIDTKTNLHSSLVPAMNRYLADKREVEFDTNRIKQALTLILRDCRTRQDFRDALPNCLKDFIPEIRDLPRTREEAYTVRNDREQLRAWNQYQRLREKIEFYAAARLIY